MTHLLERQLMSLGLSAEHPPSPEAWKQLLQQMAASYDEADRDRYLRERSLALLTVVLEAIPEGLLLADAQGVAIATNRRFAEIWRLPPELRENHTLARALPWLREQVVDPQQFFARIRHLFESPEDAVHDEIKLVDGRTLERHSVVVEHGGQQQGRLWIFRDVTDERRVKAEQLQLNERLVGLGSLAASVGHEINNPLACVIANLDYLFDAGDQKLGESDRRDIEQDVRDGLERIREIVRDLGSLARDPDRDDGQTVDLATILRSCVSMAGNQIRHRAQLEERLDDVGPIRGNPGRLGQVFLNLLVNGTQAIPEGNSIGNKIIISLVRAGDTARVIIEDSGCGIAPEHMARIFDPFFTTKQLGEGTGLGLAVVRTVVEQHGGTIAVWSEAGRGTRFTISFPLASEAAVGAESTPEPPVPIREGIGEILVVDDDAAVLRAVVRMLPGRQVSTCGDVPTARALVRARSFDVIVCDLMMPDDGGVRLYRELEAIGAREKVVVMTGGAFSAGARAVFEEASQRLHKPFSRSQLLAAIDEAAGARVVARVA
jgi:signal transduction histidine kinase